MDFFLLAMVIILWISRCRITWKLRNLESRIEELEKDGEYTEGETF